MLADWLRGEGLEPVPVRSFPAAMQELQSRRCDVLIADSVFAADGRLRAAVRGTNRQAQLLVLNGPDRSLAAEPRDIVCLRRPLDQAMLLCHVAMAVVEGRPARRSIRKRVAPFEVVVEGFPAYLIDVSNEGLRLELPRGRRTAPAPSFTVRVPMLGIALAVQRAWMSSAPGADGIAWCGGTLHQPHPRAERNWRAFVDAVPTR